MNPAGDQNQKWNPARETPRFPVNVSSSGDQSLNLQNLSGIHFGNTVSSGIPPPSAPHNPMAYVDFRGFSNSSSAMVDQSQSYNHPSYSTGQMLPNMPNIGVGGGVGAVGSRSTIDNSKEADEERKRLAQIRQQSKIRQSFQDSKNKRANQDDLMGQIIADFGPIAPNKPTAAKSVDRRETHSRPATPHDSPVLSSQRDRRGSLDIAPKDFLRPREPASDPVHSRAAVNQSTIAKPDIADLMMKFSDLSTPAAPNRKAFSTVPANIVQAPVVPKPTSYFNDSQSAVDWKSLSSDLSSAFAEAAPIALTSNQTRPGAVVAGLQSDLPPWCSDVTFLPPVYRNVLQFFKNQPMSKSAVLGVLSRSGLGNNTLEHIWTSVCRTQENFLSRNELCAALGLIGLAQTNFDVQDLTIDVLRRIPNPPEPSFITSPPTQMPVINSLVSLNPSFHEPQNLSTATFHDIPLHPSGFSLASQKPDIPSFQPTHEEEEFADFVSGPSHIPSGAKIESGGMNPDLTVFAPVIKKPPVTTAQRQRSMEDPGWGDWAKPELTVPVASVPSAKPNMIIPPASMVFRPEMIGRSFDNLPAPIMTTTHKRTSVQLPTPLNAATQPVSVKPVKPEAVTASDPYAALRDLSVVPAALEDAFPDATGLERLSLSHTAMVRRKENSFGQLSDFAVDSPSTGLSGGEDELSVQSLEFGNLNLSSSSDLGTIGFDEPYSFSTSDAVPSLVLDNLDLGIEMPQIIESPNDGVDTTTGSTFPVELDHAEVWLRVLRTCAALLEEACAVFNSVDNSAMLMKVLGRAASHIQSLFKVYIQNLTEVYRVARRVYIGARSTGLIENEVIVDSIKAVEEAWTDLTTFLSMAGMEPQPGSMDFVKADLSPQSPTTASLCGVCLLDVNAKSRARKSRMAGASIEHEGRVYHSACANFWVNCIDLQLPRLIENTA